MQSDQTRNKKLLTKLFKDSTSIGSVYDWQYDSYPSGKMLGGCSKMNACIFMRGTQIFKSEKLLKYEPL